MARLIHEEVLLPITRRLKSCIYSCIYLYSLKPVRKLAKMGHYQARSKELKHTKKQLEHKARYETRSEMSVREQRARLQELKAEFLTHPKLDKYVSKLFDMALDDDHNNQSVAIRIIADRVLPNNAFAHSAKGNNSVNINISGLTVDVEKAVNDDVVDEQ